MAVVVGLGGLVLYGLYYGAYAGFYAAFGLTPEDVGISWPQAFGRMLLVPVAVVAAASGPWIVLVAFFGILVPGALCLGVLALAREGRARVVERFPGTGRLLGPEGAAAMRRFTPPFSVVALAGALVVSGAAETYRSSGKAPVESGWTLEFLVFLLVAWGSWAVLREFVGGRAGSITRWAAVVVLVASAQVVLHSAVVDAAKDVREEGRWAPAAMAVGIVPQYVTLDVHVNVQGGSLVNGRTMLLLGSVDGVDALFDCAARTVLRVETQHVTLTHVQVDTDADVAAAARRCRAG